MLTTDQINDLHRLYVSEKWAIRKIERHLKMGWKTIKKYLDAPAQGASSTPAPEQARPVQGPDRRVAGERSSCHRRTDSSADLRPRIQRRPAILQEYVRKVRPQPQAKRAFVRDGTACRRTLRSGLGAFRIARTTPATFANSTRSR